MENNFTTIESKVAAAILERKVGSIKIEGVTYEIAPPSLATLILVSETISTLPTFDKLDKSQWLDIVAHYAKDYKPLGDIAAILILGAKNLTEKRELIIEKRRFFGLLKRRVKVVETIDRKAELANALLLNVRPSVLNDTIIERLKQNEAASFFATITSLSAVNILKPTKAEVIN